MQRRSVRQRRARDQCNQLPPHMRKRDGLRARRQRNMKWTTLVQHERVRRLQPADLYAVVFTPRDWNGCVITLTIPWCVVECYRPGHAPIFINDPPEIRDIGRWLEWVCAKAWRARAALFFSAKPRHKPRLLPQRQLRCWGRAMSASLSNACTRARPTEPVSIRSYTICAKPWREGRAV